MRQIERIHKGPQQSICFSQVLRIRIRILLLSSKFSKKNLDSYCFVTSLWLFIFENDVNVALKNNKQKKLKISCHPEGHWRKKPDQDPDSIPLVTGTGQNIMDPQRCFSLNQFVGLFAASSRVHSERQI